jgi:hypothetical protein
MMNRSESIKQGQNVYYAFGSCSTKKPTDPAEASRLPKLKAALCKVPLDLISTVQTSQLVCLYVCLRVGSCCQDFYRKDIHYKDSRC